MLLLEFVGTGWEGCAWRVSCHNTAIDAKSPALHYITQSPFILKTANSIRRKKYWVAWIH